MQKKDMIKDLAIKYNISQAESKRIFDAIFDELSEVLSKGDYFTEAGFGTFTVAHVKKRKGYNPAIQKFMMLPPKLKPKFKSSDILKSKVNGWNDDTVIDDDDSDDDENEQLEMSNEQLAVSNDSHAELDSASHSEATEVGKSTESSAALDSSATLGMTKAVESENASSSHESEPLTEEEQSALINEESQEAANV